MIFGQGIDCLRREPFEDAFAILGVADRQRFIPKIIDTVLPVAIVAGGGGASVASTGGGSDRAFIARVARGALAANFQVVELFNPASNPNDVLLDKITLEGNASALLWLVIATQTDIGGVQTAGRDKADPATIAGSGAGTKASDLGALPAGSEIYRVRLGAAIPWVIPFDPPITVGESNRGIVVSVSTQNNDVACVFEWRERPRVV